MSPACTTFGTRIASGSASQAASRSSVAPRGLERVDPDHDLAAAIAAVPDGGADLIAGERFGVRRHGVLEIEDQGIGRDGLGLLERPLV
jgi:hypothetical protein